MNLSAETLSAALERLGPDPAAVLQERGIKGRRCKASCCPVANYLRQEFGVTSSHCILIDETAASVYTISVEMPYHVAAFIAAFDDGRFPHLSDA